MDLTSPRKHRKVWQIACCVSLSMAIVLVIAYVYLRKLDPVFYPSGTAYKHLSGSFPDWFDDVVIAPGSLVSVGGRTLVLFSKKNTSKVVVSLLFKGSKDLSTKILTVKRQTGTIGSEFLLIPSIRYRLYDHEGNAVVPYR